MALGRIVADLEEVPVPSSGGDWRMAWHPPAGAPPGRPREVLEEACATVTGARLLGFVRSRCLRGHEEGLVLVRSIWRAEVSLLPWQPAHEIPFRRVVPARHLARHLWMEDGAAPIYSRAAREAALG